MKSPFSTTVFLGFCLCLGLAAQETKASSQRQEPPEQAEYMAALRMADVSAKIKELRRIKAAYPNSTLSYNIDYNLLDIITKNTANFKEMLNAQKEVISDSQVADRFLILVDAAIMMLNHGDAAKNAADALQTIKDYKAEGMALLDVPETFAKYEGTRRARTEGSFKNMFEIPLAKAMLMNSKALLMDDKAQDALEVLEAYGNSAQPGPAYYAALGDTYQQLKRDQEAMDAYFEAAIAGNEAGVQKSKALYAKINGSDKNFYNELARRRGQRPVVFALPPFRTPENWKGKAAVAEVFTGSECGPCVAATFTFDALEDSYPAQYLAVLKYHLPIPQYDPMMNPATSKRQAYYGRVITGAPTTIIDGVALPSIGGDRLATKTSFDRAKRAIDAAIAANSEITISAKAAIKGDIVTVNCEFSKVIEGADYNVALLQTEEEFKGGNGIARHNMVVRDFKSVAPVAKATVTFNIAESEKAADAFVTEWAKTASERNKQLSNTRRNKIDRKKLKAVVFVQDKTTKQVFNAFVADVSFPAGDQFAFNWR